MHESRRSIIAGPLRVFVGACLLAAIGPRLIRAQEWQPQEPSNGGRDWVQLTSGEWIAGTIDLVRDLKMEFDSDDLDNLVVDWEDVAAFRSPRLLTYAFTQNRAAMGPATMLDGVIRVTMHGEVQEFRRSDLLSIIEGGLREINYWGAKASIGLTARAGNTEQQDINTILKIKREATRSRLNINYEGNYGRLDGNETTNNNTGSANFNLFVSRRFFVTPVTFEIFSDKLKNIDHRTTLGAGGGYYIFRKSDIDWSIGVSAAYQVSQFLSVGAGEQQDEKTSSLVPQTNLEWDITGDVTFDLDYRSQIGVPDPKMTTHRATGLLTIDFLSDIFNLSMSATWDRDENPRPDAEGVVPKRDDFQTTLGFAVDL